MTSVNCCGAHRRWIDVCFPGRTNQNILSAASRDRIYSGPKNKCEPPINVFTVEEYESNGKTQEKWTRVGAAFPHKEGLGLSIELKAFPLDGRLVALPPDTDDANSRNGK